MVGQSSSKFGQGMWVTGWTWMYLGCPTWGAVTLGKVILFSWRQVPEKDSAETYHLSTLLEAGKMGVSVKKVGEGTTPLPWLHTRILRTEENCWNPKETKVSPNSQRTQCRNVWTTDPRVKERDPRGGILRLILTGCLYRCDLGQVPSAICAKSLFFRCLF